MKVVGIVQARMGSTRLPGKVLAPIAGRPLLAVLVERVRRAKLDELWLATTTSPEDDVLAEWGRALGMRVFRGSVDDVLSRFAAVVEQSRPDWLVRLTADDPFVDAGVVDLLVEAAARAAPSSAVISEDPGARRLPLGYAPQIARGEAVLRAVAAIPADEPHHRSHVLSWFYQTGEASFFDVPSSWVARPGWRWTVDTPADLAMAQAAFALLGEEWRSADYVQIARRLDERPDVAGVNVHVAQKELVAG